MRKELHTFLSAPYISPRARSIIVVSRYVFFVAALLFTVLIKLLGHESLQKSYVFHVFVGIFVVSLVIHFTMMIATMMRGVMRIIAAGLWVIVLLILTGALIDAMMQ